MSQVTPPPPSGWYPDPQGGYAERWWNGLAWTATTRPATAVPSFLLPPAEPVSRAYATELPMTVPPFHAVALHDPSRTAIQAPYAVTRPIWAPLVRTMGQAIRGVLSRYAQFEGRASRSEFWLWTLFSALIGVGSVAVIALSFALGITAALGVMVYFALIGWWLAVLVPTLAVSVRRLRDAGYPWALILLSLVPFGSIVLLVLHCQPTKHP